MARKKNTSPDAVASYHLGCDRQGPRQTYIVGGQAASYYTERLQKSALGTNRVIQFGQIVQLRKDQVDRLMEEVHRHVVRNRKVIDAASPRYHHQRGDHPVGMYIYCIPTEQTVAPSEVDDGLPPRIVENAEDWKRPQLLIAGELEEEQRRADLNAQAFASALKAAGLGTPTADEKPGK